ncbi:unnamed protein product [Acanthoscelides obtectus]|uniref:Dual specificity protein phosphatase 23 n=1 Tax=Acanthoscelides obtectus TaxID=200917 RepID=A0A9P0K9Q0_ACAOB|nr:unnamed protein product [Acanthoscelides obtectus]CAK1626378.1 Dual specificity protein phosphatase 23 [Acanthoscelides obtectus]
MSKAEYSTPPYNFSWIVEGCLAGMACPSNTSEIRYLVENGIGHLVTLSKDRIPPMDDDSIRNHIKWTVIPVVEFEPPTLDDMKKFIAICKEHQGKSAVGVHCRMGRGRTGVMLACYLVRFHGLSPDKAITEVRLKRPGSIETYQQEVAVKTYHDFLRSTAYKTDS